MLWGMLERRVTLFRIFGFSVRLHVSWLLLGVLIAWSLAEFWFKSQAPGLGLLARWTLGAVGALGLLFSIVFHELSHSLVARRHGIPIRGITLFLFGGVAEMENEPPDASSEFFMAIVGPLSSFVLAALLGGLWWWGGTAGWPEPLRLLLLWLALLNGMLGAFNLVPAFPLDGGRVLRAVLWGLRGDLRWATRVVAMLGAAFGLLLIILGVIQVVTGGPLVGGMWLALIGFFLRSAAQGSYRQLLTREALAGEPVRRFMVGEPVTVSRAVPVSELVSDYIYRHQRKVFPVVDGERLLGLVSLAGVRQVPRDEWDRTSVGEIAEPVSEKNTIGPDEDAVEALTRMSRTGSTRLMVVEEGRLVGVLALRDLLEFLALKLELEKG
jgi:Zn-dependent protease